MKAGWQEKILVLTLAGVQFSHIMDFMIMMPLGPQLMRVFGIAPSDFGLVVSVYTFSAAISCFLATFVMDRIDRKTSLITIYIGMILGTFLCGLAPNFHFLLGARALTGIFGGLLQAIILAIVGDVVPENRRGAAIGVVMAAMSVASIVGIPTGLAIAAHWGWHATFITLGCVCLGILVLAVRVVPKVKPRHVASSEHLFHGMKDLLSRRNTWKAMAFMMTLMALFAIIPFFSPYLVSIVGVPEEDLSFVFLFSGLATLVVSPLTGRLVDRYGVKRVFVVASLLSIPPLLVFVNLGPATLITAIVLNTVVSALGTGRFTPAMALLNHSIERARRGSFMTLISAVQQMSASLASYAGGLFLGSGALDFRRFAELGTFVALFGLVSTLMGGRIKVSSDL